MFDVIVNSPSKSFLCYCFAFLFGIAGASALQIIRIDIVYIFVGLFVPTFFLFLFWNDKKTRFVSLVLLFLLLGIARYSSVVPIDSTVQQQTEPIIVTVVREPDVRIDSVKYIVQINEGSHTGELIYISSGLYPRYKYGDQLSLECDLERPEPFADYRYDMYLASRGIFLTCPRPSINLVQTQTEIDFFGSLYVFKGRIAEQITTLWPEPYASFMAGLLYGYRGGLGSLQEQFNTTGVTHIVAISGYNITIISTILLSVFISLRVRRQQAFWIVVLGIALFVLFVGASASVVRAGIMGILVLVARQMGRLSSIGNVLALTAVVMAAWNPYVLLWDAGFQLSFLATMGLVYVAPLFDRYVTRVPEVFGLRESMVATLSATVATLPLILFQFGRLSIVSPIVNMFILPIIPFIMSVGFFATTMSFVFYPLGQYIGYIAWGGMVYIVSVVRWFAELSFAAVDVTISVSFVIVMYAILLSIIVRYKNVE
jgi:competence protein ComEC